jgi:hypothetical protein
MLTKFHKVLLGLLGLQLLLLVVVMVRQDTTEAVKEAPLLAGFDAEKVTRVRVFAASGEKPAVELVKRGAAWVVASHFDYPADAAKVKTALSPLGKLAAGAPIVTSANRHKQLRVAEKEFDRKLGVEVDGKERAIYTGGPAGARRTAVRLGDEDEVYGASGVSPFSSEPSAFVSTKYVELPKSEVTKVAVQRDGHVIEVERVVAAPAPAGAAGPGSGAAGSAAGSGSAAAGSAGSAAGSGADAGSGSAAAPAPAETWKLSIDGAAVTLAAGESLDTDAIDRIVGQAATIDLRAPADPKRDASKPTATITIQRKGAPQPIVLDAILEAAPAPAKGDSAAAAPGGESYWLHQRGLDRAILADKRGLADLIQADRDKLVKKPPPPPAPPAGAGSGATPPGPGAGAAPIVPPLPPSPH